MGEDVRAGQGRDVAAGDRVVAHADRPAGEHDGDPRHGQRSIGASVGASARPVGLVVVSRPVLAGDRPVVPRTARPPRPSRRPRAVLVRPRRRRGPPGSPRPRADTIGSAAVDVGAQGGLGRLERPADQDRGDAGQRHEQRDEQQHDRRPDEVGDRPDDQDRQEAGDRHQHVQDAEHAAADVLRQVLLELGLGRDRDERVGDPGEERESDDQRQQRRDGRQVRKPGRLAGPGDEVADLAGAGDRGQRMPSMTRLPSITRRRGRSRP